MSRIRHGGGTVAAALALAIAISPPAAAQDPVIVYGMGTGRPVDAAGNENRPPPSGGHPVPAEAQAAASLAFRTHATTWGAPRVQTLLNRRPVVFWIEDPNRGGSAGNFLPTERRVPGTVATALPEGFRELFLPFADQLCTPVGEAEGWCSGTNYSVVMRSGTYTEARWALPLLFSHEFVHLKQREWIGNDIMENYAPHWFYEGSANGWGFAFMEQGDLTRRAIARRLATGSDTKQFGFFLGLRYYDQPLDVDGLAYAYPRNHPDYPSDGQSWQTFAAAGLMRCRDYGLRENEACRDTVRHGAVLSAYSHVQMAGYMTGSFYRHMLVGRPQGARAVQTMMREPAPRVRSGTAWLGWLDENIRVARVVDDGGTPVTGPNGRPVSVWPGGIRQIYAEMVTVLADLPDNAGWGRNGELAASRYDARLWSHGCNSVDLTQQDAVTRNVRIAPIASRCFRVRAAPPSDYETTLVITVSSSQREVCDDLQLGSRGQIVRYPTHIKRDDGCSIGWLVPFEPLNARDPGGLQGDQRVLLINAADRAVETDWRDVEVDFTYFQIGGSLDAAAEPDERAEAVPSRRQATNVSRRPGKTAQTVLAKRVQRGGVISGKGRPRIKLAVMPVALEQRRRLPQPRSVEIQPAPLPLAIRDNAEDDAVCAPTDRAIFECGPMTRLGFATGEVADMARQSVRLVTAPGLHDMRSSALEDNEGQAEDMFDVINARSAQGQAQLNALIAGMARGVGPRGTRMELRLPPLALGQTGQFPARVDIDWSDGAVGGGGTVDSVGPLGPEWGPNGCNEGTPPSQATVNIVAHRPGYLVGAFSARLYQPNPSEDAEEVCRRPYVEVGQVSMSFVTAGVHPPLREAGGTSEISSVWTERYALDDLSTVLQAAGGMPAGMAGALGSAASTRAASGAEAEVGDASSSLPQLRAACPTRDDIDQFIAAQLSQMRQAGITDQSTLDQYEQVYRGLPPESLATAVCDWVEQERSQ
jgi:hypothetical protein